MKKIILLLVAIAVFAGIFVACGNGILAENIYAVTSDGILKLKNHKKIVYTGVSTNFNEFDGMKNAEIIRANGFVGIVKKDGTVLTNSAYNNEIKIWKDITDIAIGYDHIVGLHSDGTLISAGRNKYSQCDIYDFKDIVDVKAGAYHTVVLDENGKLNAVGDWEKGQKNFSGWSDISTFDCGPYSTVAVSKEGTVFSTITGVDGYDVSKWTDIVAVATSDEHTVGLKADGTVVATGSNKYGECDVSHLKNIETIKAAPGITVAINKNGKVFAFGNDDKKQVQVKKWK